IIRVGARGKVGDDVMAPDELPVQHRDYRDANFLIVPTPGLVERVKAVYPGHDLREHKNTRGERLFYTYQVAAAEGNAKAGVEPIWRFWDERFGQLGKQLGQVQGPSALAADGSGRVYVADTGNRRIEVFDATGKALAAWGKAGNVDGGFVQIADVAV